MNNSLNLGCGSNIAADFRNINIIGRHGGSSNITTSRSSNAAANNSIISDPLSGRGSQQRRKDLVRDPVVTLNSGGDREIAEPGVSEEEDTAELVSESDNYINNGSSSDITADGDSIRMTTEQTVPTEERDLPTTMKQTESKPTNKELVIET